MPDDQRLTWPLATLARVFRAGRSTQPERDFAQVHRNSQLTLHLYAFAARVRIGGVVHEVQAGDVTLTPPGEPESFSFTRSGMHWFLRLVPGAAGAGPLMRLGRHHRLGHRSVEARRRIEGIIQDFRTAAGEADHPAAWAAAAGAHALLCWLAAHERAAPAPGASEVCVAKAATLLRSLECAALPIGEVARRAGMSQNRLAKAFAECYGLTMTQYRVRHLVEAAKWLMESTDLPLAVVRKRLEIQDPQQFNRLFRRMTGLSPRAWLAEHAPTMVSSPRPVVASKPAKPVSG